jgi:hypothetical protein
VVAYALELLVAASQSGMGGSSCRPFVILRQATHVL